MDTSIQNNLCKGLRACGVSKELTHQVMDHIIKWYDNNGPEWTLKRIKDLRQWYETSLTGNPVMPAWFKHGEDNLPLGVWKSVFKLPIAKALGVLSCGTVFYEKAPSPTQLKKFEKGLAGNGSTHGQDEFERFSKSLHHDIRGVIRSTGRDTSLVPASIRRTGEHLRQMPDLELPTVFDMNGSVPVHNGRERMHPKNSLGHAYKALEESWESVPQVTWDFLISQDKLDWLPITNEWRLELDGKHDECVGTIGVVQEPELKARFVANTNRITQKTLDPLKKVLEECTHRNPMSCIYDQDAGMEWVRKHLQEGHSLSGCDLTSASDLLNLESCMDLVEAAYGLRNIEGYLQYREYYLEVSRSKWFAPFNNSEVKWRQGSPMGTGPSIFYLDLANGACIMLAYMAYCKDLLKKGLKPEFKIDEAGRTIGDDAIVRTELAQYYTTCIERLGGEVNVSKTLTSEKVAEFAGRVITPDAVYLKKVKYAEPSDNSFLAMIAQLGPQAKWLLSRDQYKIWDKLKEVPGIVIPGPWTRDSYGLSLEDRYSWYLECVQPILDSADAELDKIPLSYILYKAGLAAKSAELSIDPEHKIPWPMEESYLDSTVTNAFKTHGDPRLTNGKTLREVLLPKIGHIESYSSWKERTRCDRDPEMDRHVTQNPSDSPSEEVKKEKAIEEAPTSPKRVSHRVVHDDWER